MRHRRQRASGALLGGQRGGVGDDLADALAAEAPAMAVGGWRRRRRARHSGAPSRPRAVLGAGLHQLLPAPDRGGPDKQLQPGSARPAARQGRPRAADLPNGGTVFSTGSIAWRGTLAQADGDNDVSQIPDTSCAPSVAATRSSRRTRGERERHRGARHGRPAIDSRGASTPISSQSWRLRKIPRALDHPRFGTGKDGAADSWHVAAM